MAALAERCGLNRATAWRLLGTLRARALVALDPVTGHYRVGPGLLRLAGAAGPQALVDLARPELERACAQTGETAALAVPAPALVRWPRVLELTYVDEVMPAAVISATWSGRAVPLHATSTGKALLAALPAEQAAGLLGDRPEAFTPTTLTDPDALAAELVRTRRRGYAICAGELEPALWGVSAAVLDTCGHPSAVVSLWGPSARVSADRFDELGTVVRAAAARIASTLG